MAGMLDLLQGLQVQQAPDPRTQNWGMDSLNNALSGLANQMERDKERKRLAAEREQKQARDRFELLQKLSSQAQGAGDKQRAGELYQQSVDYGNKLGLSMKPLVGGRRMLSGADVLNMDMTQNPNVGLNDAGQPYAQDFTNDQSQSRISGWNGYKPTLKGFNATDDVLDEFGNVVRKGTPKPDHYGQATEYQQWRMSGGGGSEGGVTWSAPDANGYQTGSNGQVRHVGGMGPQSSKPVNFKTWLENNTDETLPKIMTPQEIDAAVRQDLSAWINGHGMMKPKPAEVHRQKNQLTTKYQQQNDGEKARLTRLRQQYRGQGGTDDGAGAQPAAVPTGGGSSTFMTEFQKLMAPALSAVGKLPAR